MAKEFDSGVKTELHILKDFEDTLRELGPIADDLETISEQLTEHKVSEALSHRKTCDAKNYCHLGQHCNCFETLKPQT